MQKQETNTKSFKFDSKPKPLPLSYQDTQISDLEKKERELFEEIEQVYKIVQNSSSYEEALSKIEKFDNPKMEEALERYIFANGVLSELE
jgi:CRISPR/Cas system CSM-associated protein Csm5 (group 7 of RAMP superfamily)